MNIKEYQTIEFEIDNFVAKIILAREEVKNAINGVMIEELIAVFMQLQNSDEVRVIIISGKGDTFVQVQVSNWLKEVEQFSYQENFDESRKLVELLYLIHNHSKAIICFANGSAVGGGIGLMLASDIILAEENAKFGISEVAIGIIPAAIIPFVISRIGETKGRELLITGERFGAIEAQELGLINYYGSFNEMQTKTNKIAKKIIQNGQNAISKVKEMISITPSLKDEELLDYIAKVIADLRQSEEGKEGINSFLNKRKPNWIID